MDSVQDRRKERQIPSESRKGFVVEADESNLINFLLKKLEADRVNDFSLLKQVDPSLGRALSLFLFNYETPA